MNRAEAEATLLSRWLEAFGPATETDIAWWTGWTLGSVRQALDRLGATTVSLTDSAEGYVLPDDVEPVTPADPWVAFLPSLDVTTMGWKERAWVPRRTRRRPVRSEWERRANGVGKRTCRGRLGRSVPQARWSTNCSKTSEPNSKT